MTDAAPDWQARLAREGYINLGQVFGEDVLDNTRRRIDDLLTQEGSLAGTELRESSRIRHPVETGVERLADLVNKGAEFEIFFTLPILLDAVASIIGKHYRLSSLNYRAALPGYGQQALHVDWRNAVAHGDYRVCNAIWLLDDFTAINGATRLVPGSHNFDQLPVEAMDDPEAPHPGQILIEAPAGSLIVFNSHLWHGGTINRSNRRRRAIHSYFCHRNHPQQLDQRRYLRADTRARLDPQALWLLDVD